MSAALCRRKLALRRDSVVSANGRLNDYILGFGIDDRGEAYVGGKDVLGPTGTTGKVYRLIPAPGEDDADDDDDEGENEGSDDSNS